MTTKKVLQKLQKSVPSSWLYPLQDVHSNLIFHWIVRRGSKASVAHQKSAMVFSPHQDDETFGCGGIIALKRENGVSVTVVFLTDGQGGSNPDPKITNEIIQTRKREAVEALNILGVEPSAIIFLDKQDGTLQDLHGEERKKIIGHLANLLKAYKPEEVYVPHRKDCHIDHEATCGLVKEALNEVNLKVELLQYPIWLFWRAPLFIMLKLQDIAFAYHVSIESVQDKKKRAIESYLSQTESLPKAFVKRFSSSCEIFFKSNS
jgi:N-acetylglucosamine malate deacetylase 1